MNGVTHPFSKNLATLICPSDSNAKLPPNLASNTNNPTRTSYRGNRGDVMARTDWQETRGVFADGRNVTPDFGFVTDGTSNTVMFGEALVGRGSFNRVTVAVGRFKDVSTHNSDTAFRQAFPKTECMKIVDMTNKVFANAGTDDLYDTIITDQGIRFSEGAMLWTNFLTILPPNSPSCTWRDHHRTLMSLGSNHTGGANVCAVDGSAHFISNTIDCGTNDKRSGEDKPGFVGTDPQKYTGKSTLGIWGALGTSCAGDTGSF
jgi:hypothetical protein